MTKQGSVRYLDSKVAVFDSRCTTRLFYWVKQVKLISF